MKQTSNDYIVYKHTCPNGKVYIGITKNDVNTRWKNGYGYVHNSHFTNAIKKYGWDNIHHEIVFSNLSKDEAERIEVDLIKHYNSTNRLFGYNKDSGGNVNKSHSEETKLKISLSQKGKPRPESKRVKSLAERKKLSIANIGNKHAVGSKRTDKHKQILRDLKSKKVVQLDLNGEFICEYSSLAEAEKNTKISKGNICGCIKGNRTVAGGYKWKYVI